MTDCLFLDFTLKYFALIYFTYSFIKGDSSYFQIQSKITNNGRALFWDLAWSFRVVESGKNFVEFVNSL